MADYFHPFVYPSSRPAEPNSVAISELPERLSFQVQSSNGAYALSCPQPTSVQINLAQLNPFEVVDHQFQRWGVTFSNAIALYPSNPAFPPLGKVVLIGAPRDGWLEASFHHPIQSINAVVTGSRTTVMTAFDNANQPIAQVSTPGPNLAGDEANTSPNCLLSLNAKNIHRITVHAFDGQFTLSEMAFTLEAA